MERYRAGGILGQDEDVKKRPLSVVERIAQKIEARAAKRAAERERALADYERIVARLRSRARGGEISR